jgi:hypothetical protein
VDRIPVDGVTRPAVDPGHTATVSLAREEASALVAAAAADRGRQALRNAAVIRLLLHNALRVDGPATSAIGCAPSSPTRR